MVDILDDGCGTDWKIVKKIWGNVIMWFSVVYTWKKSKGIHVFSAKNQELLVIVFTDKKDCEILFQQVKQASIILFPYKKI